ncbi:MAG: hypothetical protein J1E95_12050 [Muribaculaceae bacterium]|nr:hypothetical protein [Muribaculaceae bacterium]
MKVGRLEGWKVGKRGTRLRQTKLAFERKGMERRLPASKSERRFESWKVGREWSGGFQPPKAKESLKVGEGKKLI